MQDNPGFKDSRIPPWERKSYIPEMQVNGATPIPPPPKDSLKMLTLV